MKKPEKNKFKINSKSLSLTKINPYFNNKENYLPYKYKDPSFKTEYNGPLMQKDYYIVNLMNNRLKKINSYKKINKDNLPFIQSSPIEVSKKTDLVFNSAEYEKQKIIKEYAKYAFLQLKRYFFCFNPISSKNDLINYRRAKFKGKPLYKEKIRYNPKLFMDNFQNKMNQNNYKNWERIKEEYELKEVNEPQKIDKFYDENKIWKILNINNFNKLNSNVNSYSHLTEDAHHRQNINNNNMNKCNSYRNRNSSLPLTERQKKFGFKSEKKSNKKNFFPLKIKEKTKLVKNSYK